MTTENRHQYEKIMSQYLDGKGIDLTKNYDKLSGLASFVLRTYQPAIAHDFILCLIGQATDLLSNSKGMTNIKTLIENNQISRSMANDIAYSQTGYLGVISHEDMDIALADNDNEKRLQAYYRLDSVSGFIVREILEIININTDGAYNDHLAVELEMSAQAIKEAAGAIEAYIENEND